MPNHLVDATSPYLLQHAENPVDWYPWGSTALSRAKSEDKPIFLSIGYAACHWCHVMAHESFEDPAIAEILNGNFICIKVDREERPDLDSIYMAAVVAMTQSGGWPMSVFLTPDLKPFYGGTYFPPSPRHNLPSFREVIIAVAAAWQRERSQVVQVAEQILANIRQSNQLDFSGQKVIHPKILAEALTALLTTYDWAYGGWGRAPKFPQPMAIEYLLRQGFSGNSEATDAAVNALEAMSRGGMYDVVGGGFHRYSTDSGWFVPHFEKMLYDNAQLAQVYLHAALQTGDPYLRSIAEATLDFLLREMLDPSGGFYSSIDADSPDGEGAYYLWTSDEIFAVLTDSDQRLLFETSYSINADGNFAGKNILQRSRAIEKLASGLRLSIPDYLAKLKSVHAQLLLQREKRVRPNTDTKVVLSWNALAMTALAEAGRYLCRQDYLQAAQNCGRFILENMVSGEVLCRSWRNGKAAIPAFLEDYAGLVSALLTLYQADGDQLWYSTAGNLIEKMMDRFTDPAGGFFDTADQADGLVYRPKDLQDNATPSGNSMAIRSLQVMQALTENEYLQRRIEQSLASVQESVGQYPTAFSSWLLALDAEINPPRQVAITWEKGTPQLDVTAILEIPLTHYDPRAILARSELPLETDAPDLLKDRPTLHNRPTAYVCQHFTCQLPVNTPESLRRQLG